MRSDAFDFDLPEELIALRPCEPRDAARLLVVDGSSMRDRRVLDLARELRSGDILVLNDTRVIPAALEGVRVRGEIEARISVNLHKRSGDAAWLAFARPARKLQVGDRLHFSGAMPAQPATKLGASVVRKADHGEVELTFDVSGPALDTAIATAGAMPLPPYIASKRAADHEDLSCYQTIYARRDGAVAAPTAGLHFTDRVFHYLAERGIEMAYLTLHVGAGTFLPVKAEDIQDHRMHAEWGEITPGVAQKLNAVRASGGRLIAVGTTVTRLLETAVDTNGVIQPFKGETDIFITLGYRFRAVDALLTNFHLPKSTLFMLVSAFAGLEHMRSAYAHAVAKGYRFYSYGDASLLWPADHEN